MVVHAALAFEPTGQGWTQVAEFGAAFVLSAAIGLERELKQKSAGVRTSTVVGLGSALFMLVSKYGFTDVLVPGQVVLDPSRVAAQIVSGLGFIGGGIIFVRRGSVRGLTTAASIWLTAAVGAAAGAGLLVLALVATVAYFVAILLLAPLAGFVRDHLGEPWPALRVQYLDGRGLLREVLAVVTDAGFAVRDLATSQHAHVQVPSDAGTVDATSVEGTVRLGGRGDVESVVGALSELDGVLTVATGDETEP
ncbi:putative magnesium transport MgtC family protein [Luteimicrobium album]|uniref:Magnesium transport MgtC family protein n=1 Tax=Luteimicrobium album TaxID=1054550 RepID=A0ABQ6I367_9MICO|nr:MgtC/SapB family protein [Luteimicrobium album]GMA25181.1 putative magnesium transport MgtC family protein [Luteimicrobium album]